MKCKVKDIEINYEIRGTGKPILFFSGFATDMSIMAAGYEPIFKGKEGWKRIYIDHPGVGKTKGAYWIRSSDDILEIMLSFIECLIPEENFLIIGHSFGAYLARGVLKKKFNLIDGILLTCPVIEPQREKRDIDENIEDIKFFDEKIEKRINERLQDEMYESIKNTDHDFLEGLRNHGISFSFEIDELERPFEKPALILAGKQDQIVGYRDTIKIIKNYSRSTFCIIDKGGHNIHIEQEQLFKVLVEEWLSRVDESLKAAKIGDIDYDQN